MQDPGDLEDTAKNDEVGDKMSVHKPGSKTTIFRSRIGKMRTSDSLRRKRDKERDHTKEKELINFGLHKLVSTLNTANRAPPKMTSTTHVTGGHRKSSTNSQNNYASKMLMEQPIAAETPPIAEPMFEPAEPNVVITDESTMTEIKLKEQQIDLENSPLSQKQCRDMQWTDPRLLKKYCMVRQPFKKSMTIPIVKNEDAGNELISEISEEDEEELAALKRKHYFVHGLYYFCTASVSLIGAVCGLALTTLILWKVMDEYYTHIRLRPQPEFFLKYWIRSVSDAISMMVGGAVRKLLHVLTVPTRQVLAQEEEAGSWLGGLLNSR